MDVATEVVVLDEGFNFEVKLLYHCPQVDRCHNSDPSWFGRNIPFIYPHKRNCADCFHPGVAFLIYLAGVHVPFQPEV